MFTPHHHHHHHLNNLTYTPTHSIPMQGIPRQRRQLPRPSLLHSSPTPKPLVRVACVLVGRYLQGCRADLLKPCRSPIQPLCCAITTASHRLSHHIYPTRDGVVVCDVLHHLATSVYNNGHSLLRHRRLSCHWHNIHSHTISMV
jgi:hypothetical protein